MQEAKHQQHSTPDASRHLGDGGRWQRLIGRQRLICIPQNIQNVGLGKPLNKLALLLKGAVQVVLLFLHYNKRCSTG